MADIIKHVPPLCWRWHVNTLDNPADAASRGMSPRDLRDFTLWWQGHPSLPLPPGNWPIRTDLTPIHDLSEMKTNTLIVSLVTEGLSSFYQSLVHVLSCCRRFIANCRTRREKRLTTSSLHVEEIEETEKHMFRQLQLHHFVSEIQCLQTSKSPPASSVFLDRRPFLDHQGFLRVGCRLRQVDSTFTSHHLVILYQKAHLTKLLVMHLHVTAYHAGPTALMGLLVTNYHLIGAK